MKIIPRLPHLPLSHGGSIKRVLVIKEGVVLDMRPLKFGSLVSKQHHVAYLEENQSIVMGRTTPDGREQIIRGQLVISECLYPNTRTALQILFKLV